MINNDILNLEPKNIWKNFLLISQIPRPSKSEEKIRNFLENFGKKLNLETIRDDIGNIIIKKKSTNNSNRTIILQSHMDMVPQKNENIIHNFSTDEIKSLIDGNFIKAKGTTLGADNGIGVATMMTILESNIISHPNLECLFTTDEETGMTGVKNLNPDILKGDTLINLDSEEIGEICIGCAGGIDITIKINYNTKPVKYNSFLEIGITGLLGGHSGADINLGRANANKLIIELIEKLNDKENIQVLNINGGNLRNAIPREAFCQISVEDINQIKNKIEEFEKDLKFKFKKTEPNIKINIKTIKNINSDTQAIENKVLIQIINKIKNCPNGVYKMDENIKDLVQTSNNLASIKTKDSQIIIKCLTRSSNELEKEKLVKKIKEIFNNSSTQITTSGSYPGWDPNTNSKILEIAKKEYEKLTGKNPIVKSIHAGLECGLIGGIYPNLDMISIGPTIEFPHSPDERCEIKTVETFYNHLVEILKKLN